MIRIVLVLLSKIIHQPGFFIQISSPDTKWYLNWLSDYKTIRIQIRICASSRIRHSESNSYIILLNAELQSTLASSLQPTLLWTTLRDVHHIPEVRLELTLANQLDDEGYTGRIRNGIVIEVLQRKLDYGSSPKDQHIVSDACLNMPGGSERGNQHCR